ncbi:MAG: hypothetical protein IJU91_02790 [Selenomonadaceae bacterium]|nr:hypothetical protein [Selenomonadaceae bacterium]
MKTEKYKGFQATVKFEENIFFGRLDDIEDLVTFECENKSDVENEFRAAVDDYLDFCESVRKGGRKNSVA